MAVVHTWNIILWFAAGTDKYGYFNFKRTIRNRGVEKKIMIWSCRIIWKLLAIKTLFKRGLVMKSCGKTIEARMNGGGHTQIGRYVYVRSQNYHLPRPAPRDGVSRWEQKKRKKENVFSVVVVVCAQDALTSVRRTRAPYRFFVF